MKFICCLLILFLVELNNAKRKSNRQNVLRIPLTYNEMKKPKTHARTLIVIDDLSGSSTGKISIGQEKQNFDVIFDTGSEQLWVYSSFYDTCDPNAPIVFKEQKTYNHESSSTYIPRVNPDPQLYNYAQEWVFGFPATDVFTIAGVKIKRDFLEITKASKGEVTSRENGIVGLRYNPAEGNIVSQYCEVIKGENKFSYYLPSVANVSNGELLFCGEDNFKYKPGTMKYYSESQPGRWRIPVESVTMERHGISYPMADSPTVATIDTGTGGIVGPRDNITAYLNYVPLIGNPEHKKIRCSDVNKLPDLTITLDGVKHTFIGPEIIWRIKNTCGLRLIFGPADHWVFGEPFLRKYYTVFDMKHHKIGIAESRG